MEVCANLARVKLAVLDIFTDILRTILSYYTPASHLSETLKEIGIPKDNQDLKQSDEAERRKDKPKTKRKKHLNNHDSKQPDEKETNIKQNNDIKKLEDNQELLKLAAEDESYEKLDITLMKALFSIFRELPKVNKTGISKEKDRVFVDVVDEIRKTRNTFFHESEHSISNDDFKKIWQHLENICLKADQETQKNFSQRLQTYRQCVVNIDVDTSRKLNSLQYKLRHPETFSKEMMKKLELIKKWESDSSRFFPTRAYKEVERQLGLTKSLTVSGNIGSGKSSCAQNVALSYKLKDWIIIPVDDIEEIITRVEKDSRGRQLFVLDDPLGKDFIDECLFSHWKCHESTLTHILNSCDIKVLFTCRKSILNDKRIPELLIKEKVVIDDSHWQLTTFEKEKIRHVKCEKGVSFFTSPYLSIRDEIKEFKSNDKVKYCALVTLLERGGSTCDDSLSNNREALENIFQMCSLPRYMSYKCILDELEKMNGSLVEKKSGKFHFRSDIVVKATISMLQEDSQIELVRFCPLGYLRKWIRIDNGVCDKKKSFLFFHITVTDEIVNVLCDRYFKEIKKNCVEVCLCPVFKDSRVQSSICKRITKMSDDELQECFLQSLSTGISALPPITIVSQILFDLMKHFLSDFCKYISTKMNMDCCISPISFMSYSLEYFLKNKDFLAIVQDRMTKNSAVNLMKELKKIWETCATLCKNLDDFRKFKANEVFENDILNILKTVEKAIVKNRKSREENASQIELTANNVLNMEQENEEVRRQIEQRETKQMWGEQLDVDLNIFFELPQEIYKNEWATKACMFAFSKYIENVKNEMSSHQKHFLNNFLNSFALHYVNAITIIVNDIGLDKLCRNFTCWTDAFKRFEDLELCFPLMRNQDRKTLSKQVLSQLLLTSDAPDFPFLSLPSLDQTKLHAELRGFSTSRSDKIKTEIAIFAYKKSPLSCLLMFGEIKMFDDVMQRLLDMHSDKLRQHNLFFSACVSGRLDVAKQILKWLGNDLTTEKFFCLTFDFCSLHIASLLNHVEIIKYLLKEKQLDVNIVDYYGNTPLHLVLYNIEPNLEGQQYQQVISTIRALCDFGASKNQLNNMGLCPLHLACKKTFTEIVELFYNEQNINSKTHHGDTPLILAAEKGSTEVVAFLLKHGANSNDKNYEGHTPLHLAAKRGSLQIMVKLLKNNADLNCQSNQGETPLIVAASKGQFDIVKRIVNIFSWVNGKDKTGATALSGAVASGRLDIVNLLLQHKANVNLTNNDGYGPLSVAAVKGYLEISDLLIRNHANIEQCDNHGESPLMLAALHGQSDVVQLLLNKGAEVNRQNREKQSALWHACKNGHTCVTSILIKHHANDKLSDLKGCTPFITAARHGHIGPLEVLKQTKCPVNQRDNNGKTALMTACENGHVEVACALLKYCANINLSDNDGRTALWYASKYGYTNVVEVLLNYTVYIDKRDKKLKSPLFVATEKGYIEIVSLLAGRKASIELCEKNHRSPLTVASAKGHMYIVKFLIIEGANVNTKDIFDRTPLFYAVKSGQKYAVLQLLESGAEVDLMDKQGNTPLHIASKMGYKNIIHILIDRGNTSCIDSQNYDGETAFFLACENNDVSSASFLISRKANMNIRNKKGLHPFEIARSKRNIAILSLLSQFTKA